MTCPHKPFWMLQLPCCWHEHSLWKTHNACIPPFPTCHPQTPMCRNPKAFLEGLLERYVAVLQAATPGAAGAGSPLRVPAPARLPGAPAPPAPAAAARAAPAAAGDPAAPDADLGVLLSAAAVAVLQYHALLAEHVVALGYVDKLLKLLAARWGAPEPRKARVLMRVGAAGVVMENVVKMVDASRGGTEAFRAAGDLRAGIMRGL